MVSVFSLTFRFLWPGVLEVSITSRPAETFCPSDERGKGTTDIVRGGGHREKVEEV